MPGNLESDDWNAPLELLSAVKEALPGDAAAAFTQFGGDASEMKRGRAYLGRQRPLLRSAESSWGPFFGSSWA
jgi:hypothetical protein